MLESTILKEIDEWCSTIDDDDIRLFSLNFCKARYNVVKDFVKGRYEIKQYFSNTDEGIKQTLEVVDLPEGDCVILNDKLMELYSSMGGVTE